MIKFLTITALYLLLTLPPVQAHASEQWSLRCNDNSPQQCEIFQRLIIRDSNRRFAEIAIILTPETQDSYQAMAILPLGFSIPKGVDVFLDDTAVSKKLPEFCHDNGCSIHLNLSDNNLIDKMKNADKLTFVMTALNGEKLNAVFNLFGIESALKQLQ